jgi:hypothetical protein
MRSQAPSPAAAPPPRPQPAGAGSAAMNRIGAAEAKRSRLDPSHPPPAQRHHGGVPGPFGDHLQHLPVDQLQPPFRQQLTEAMKLSHREAGMASGGCNGPAQARHASGARPIRQHDQPLLLRRSLRLEQVLHALLGEKAPVLLGEGRIEARRQRKLVAQRQPPQWRRWRHR